MARVQTSSGFMLSNLNLNDARDAAIAVKNVLAGREEFRKPLDKMYLTNVDFLEGGVKQWYDWDGDTRKLDPKIESDRRLLTANYILEIAESWVARVARPGGKVEANPVSTDGSDVGTAKSQTDVLNHYRRNMNYSAKFTQFLLTVACSPIAWQEAGWSPNLGPLVRTTFDDFLASRVEDAFPFGLDLADDDERRLLIDESMKEFEQTFGKKAGKKGEIVQRAGDLFTDTISILQASWYPWDVKEWSPSELRIFVVSDWYDISYVAEMEGMSVEDVRKSATGIRPGGSAVRNLGRGNDFITGFTGDVRMQGSSEQVERHRYYVFPCEDYPDGLQGVLLGSDSEARRIGPLDSVKRRVPFFPLVQHRIPGKMWGTCLVSQIRTQQIDLNRALQASAFRRELYASPPILTPEESICDENDWTLKVKPGSQKKYRGPNGPRVLDLPTVDIGEENAISRNKQTMRELSSVSSLAVGQADDAGVKSGRAIDNLDEKTGQRLTSFLERTTAQQRDLWIFQTEELMTKPTGNQIAQVLGELNEIETFEWTREDLQPSTYGKSGRELALIDITPFSDVPLNGVELRNYVMGIVKAGILNPQQNPADKQMALEMLGTSNGKQAMEAGRIDEATQRFEIKQWLRGLPVEPPYEEQDHGKQIKVLVEWMRTPEYRDLIKAMPHMEMHIEQHLRLHRKWMIISSVRPKLEQQIATAEAWQLVQREAQLDMQTGAMDGQIFGMIPAGSQGQPAPLLDFGSLFGPPPGPQSGGGVPPGGEPNQGQGEREFVGEGEGRDVRRDLADKGVSTDLLEATE